MAEGASEDRVEEGPAKELEREQPWRRTPGWESE